jgi:hypothetical protein
MMLRKAMTTSDYIADDSYKTWRDLDIWCIKRGLWTSSTATVMSGLREPKLRLVTSSRAG